MMKTCDNFCLLLEHLVIFTYHPLKFQKREEGREKGSKGGREEQRKDDSQKKMGDNQLRQNQK